MGSEPPVIDRESLIAITRALVSLHERFHGRRPARAKSLIMHDDLLVCVLSAVYTDVEKTTIELGGRVKVHQRRRDFHAHMRHSFIAEVERLAGRKVREFIPSYHVGPDLEVQVYLLDQ